MIPVPPSREGHVGEVAARRGEDRPIKVLRDSSIPGERDRAAKRKLLASPG